MTDVQIAAFASSAHVVQCRRARSTGSVVSVLDNRTEAWSEDGKWITHCHDHASICEHDTRAFAVAWAAEPEVWCEPCRGLTTHRGGSASIVQEKNRGCLGRKSLNC